MQKKSIRTAFFLALGEVGYIFLVALFFLNMEKYFGDQPDPPAPFGIVIILTLLVISAAVSGALILGKPILLYLEGKKREAVEIFGLTLGWMFLVLVIILALGMV